MEKFLCEKCKKNEGFKYHNEGEISVFCLGCVDEVLNYPEYLTECLHCDASIPVN